MASEKSRGTAIGVIGGLLVLGVLVGPAIVSVTSDGGAICFSASACPLSAVNPCVRRPSFAIVGRCAADIR